MKAKCEISLQPPSGNHRFRNRTIRTFLAEDSPAVMVLLARILSRDRRFLIVGSAVDGRKAVDNASTLRPDLVITDLHMPALDGAEVTRYLKALPAPPVIIVATAEDTPEAESRCLAAGADAFVVKSMDLASRLLATIREFFPEDFENVNVDKEHFYRELSTVRPGLETQQFAKGCL